MRVRLCVLFCLLFTCIISSAQVPGAGIYPLGSFDNKGFDTINLGTLNMHFEIPVVSKKGRAGLNFNYNIAYDGMLWVPLQSNGTTMWVPDAGWGFHSQLNGSGMSGVLGRKTAV